MCLVCDIPLSIGETFFAGQVNIGLKDSALEASSPLRYDTELQAILQHDENVKPILLLYSNGGPDHHVTYLTTKLALIALFRKLNLDYLCAASTAPGNSWANPAERAMSLLNLSLQAVGLMREEMSPCHESVMQRCNNVAEVRRAASKDQAFVSAYIDSMEPV